MLQAVMLAGDHMVSRQHRIHNDAVMQCSAVKLTRVTDQNSNNDLSDGLAIAI